MTGNCSGTINIVTPANIVCVGFVAGSIAPNTIRISAQFRNDGGVTGTFTPKAVIDGSTVDLGLPAVSVDPGVQWNFANYVTVSGISPGAHTVNTSPGGMPNQTVTVLAPYAEANLISCTWPPSGIAGQATQMTAIVNGGTATESYKLAFTGAITGYSNPFTVNANTANQTFTVTGTFPSAGLATVTATLVKA